MSESKNKPPIPLCGMRKGGITTDGEAISFTLDALDGAHLISQFRTKRD